MIYYQLWNEDSTKNGLAAFDSRENAHAVRDLFNERYESEYAVEEREGHPPFKQKTQGIMILAAEAKNL